MGGAGMRGSPPEGGAACSTRFAERPARRRDAGSAHGAQRDRLVNAMGEVERLLTASMVSITAVDPESEDAVACLAAFGVELGERFPAGFDAAAQRAGGPGPVPPAVGRLPGRTAGRRAGRLRRPEARRPRRGRDQAHGVSRQSRGLGLGRRMLAASSRKPASAV